jgi:hypothetical protein
MVRRDAIAQLASSERRSATILGESADSPTIKSSAEWVAVRLGEIEPFFLEKADEVSDPWRENWLTAAERSLAFYVSELRRLEDLAGVPLDAGTWTRH